MTEAVAAPVTGDNSAQVTSSAAPTSADTATASTSTESWMGVNPDNVGYVQNKGWKNPEELLTSYRNFEKLMGVPQDRVMKLPGDDKPESWGPIFDKLGRPQDKSGYAFGEVDKTVAEWAGNNFHELGLSKKQGEEVMTRWNKWQHDMRTEQQTQMESNVAEDSKALKKEWGAAYEQNREIANRTAEKFGLNSNELDAMISAVGNKRLSELFYKIGAGMGEDSFISSSSTQNFNGAMTPAAAKSKIQQLRGDMEFTKRYINGDTSAKSEMDRLHAMAYHE